MITRARLGWNELPVTPISGEETEKMPLGARGLCLRYAADSTGRLPSSYHELLAALS